MTVKLTLHELQEQLGELLDRAGESDDPLVVQRRGKDDVVIVSARQWRRLALGKRLDARGPAFRLPLLQQKRAEELLAISKQRRLNAAQRRELAGLLKAADETMLRRAQALDEME